MPRIQPAPLARVVPLIVAMLAIPAALTLRTVLVPGTLEIPSDDPTPHGYTWSLLLFVFPLGVIAWWFLRHPRLTFRRRAYWLTVGILAPIGFVLDILLGHVFFEFPNRAATLGLDLPGIGGPLPIEEFVFYLAGFLFILLFYIWNDEFWLRAYNVPDYAGAVRGMERIVSFHPGALLLGAGLFRRRASARPPCSTRSSWQRSRRVFRATSPFSWRWPSCRRLACSALPDRSSTGGPSASRRSSSF